MISCHSMQMSKPFSLGSFFTELFLTALAVSAGLLLQLFCKSWFSESFPSEWKEGMVDKIPKKSSHLEWDMWRSICVLFAAKKDKFSWKAPENTSKTWSSKSNLVSALDPPALTKSTSCGSLWDMCGVQISVLPAFYRFRKSFWQREQWVYLEYSKREGHSKDTNNSYQNDMMKKI